MTINKVCSCEVSCVIVCVRLIDTHRAVSGGQAVSQKSVVHKRYYVNYRHEVTGETPDRHTQTDTDVYRLSDQLCIDVTD